MRGRGRLKDARRKRKKGGKDCTVLGTRREGGKEGLYNAKRERKERREGVYKARMRNEIG